MAAAQEDIRLVLEATYTVRACSDAAAITELPGAQASITESAANVEVAAIAHKAAVSAVQVDLSETEDARAGLGTSRRVAVARYGYVKSKAADSLLNPDPDLELLTEFDRTRREKGIARALSLRPSELSEMSARDLVAKLDLVMEALVKDPLLKPLGLASKLEPAVSGLKQSHAALERELGEDRAAYDLVVGARSSLQRKLRSHQLHVEAALVDADRQDDLGRFVLAADAAYVARRRAGTQIQDEPGAAEAETSLTPADTEIQPPVVG